MNPQTHTCFNIIHFYQLLLQPATHHPSTTMNSPTTTSNVNMEELKLFHTIDRELYCILTVFLHHDPLLAMRIMSFWFWMGSSRTYTNLILHLHSITFEILKAIALETITCLHSLDDPSPFSVSVNMIIGIPILQHIVNIDTFHIPYLVDNRVIILESMQKISDNVYAHVFDDILLGLLPQNQRNQVRASTISQEEENTIITPTVDERIVANNNSGLRRSNQHEKTVFLTFSKGYHVTETQIREFFVRRFGEIIEALIMQDVGQEEQPLFARMLVYSSDQVGMVLGGQNKVKFTINGKHVYARKYVKKNPRASSHHHHSSLQSPFLGAESNE